MEQWCLYILRLPPARRHIKDAAEWDAAIVIVDGAHVRAAVRREQIRRFQRSHSSLRHPSKKRLRISINGVDCQKLELLTQRGRRGSGLEGLAPLHGGS